MVTQQITLSRVAAQQYPTVIGNLAALIGETNAQVQATLSDPRYSLYKPVPVLSDAPLADVLYIREHPDEFPGVDAVETTERSYPQGELPGPAQMGYPASQTLGYVGSISSDELTTLAAKGYQAGDDIGQSGLEAQYESDLRGAPGTQQLEVDAKGQVVGTLKTMPAVSGNNLVTNLDLGLQQVADNALATQIINLRHSFDPKCGSSGCTPAATGGAVIVMDPQTGAVLAMSSYPTYNPSIWVNGISDADYAALTDPANNDPQINRAINGLYTPGSTFKLNTATAALDTGLITAGTYIDDVGTFKIPDCTGGTCSLHNDDSDGALGELNVTGALTESSDYFFYQLGDWFYNDRGNPAFGITPIQDQAAQYSLGEQTGIDLPDESEGRVDSPAERAKLHAEAPAAFPNTTWYTGDNLEMAFGQGTTVITPIEQAVAYSTFANGGTRYAPQLGSAVVTPTGRVVTRITPQVTGHVNLPPSTFQPMLAGFEGVVQNPSGTAYGAFTGSKFPVSELAGKTGTATTEAKKEPTAWFVGWGPTADPTYLVVCVIDQAGYGAAASAPVVRQIFDYLAANPVGPVQVPPPAATMDATGPAPLPVAAPAVAPGATTTTTTQSG